ncbi:unnamed protein product (macronuclear) [Paramecium tetraurelia]|uniref:Chromosome undetermined scaffold_151, whole genome shotgun sequence n=1 Tax=Paramecium tetraurelia TaxID=5888 RepID=A0C6B0_PARTE|nr:uncharacterized protein GSPATT00035456001 [Paramecium tetraurelia]XP_001441341.1 uncharacterized protein GSPATT00038962001 [Paramecium tetraurelia]CAK66327.1 unnamed protein product [Paramecium tetraurelia]CAK73944.1 unnamed protein product [Paramecium tetraurelia]|eukprot:XP_001433724.1 hypothetical protein (macronuclear) [Paramecium tetraurelia strain d4-2]
MQNTNLISLKSNTPTCITVSIEINPNKYKKKCILYIIVYQQQRKISTHQILQPFPNEYTIRQLKHQSMYTLKIRLEHGQENLLQTLHCNTKSDANVVIASVQQHSHLIRDPVSSNSEQQLVDVIAAENEGINIFENRQEIKSMIQKARNNSSAKGFIYSEYKVNKPPELKQERLKRIWMISKGQEFFDEVYGNIDPGFQFLKNDWFMGPFYSYDPNEELLRKNQENRDLQINQSL